MRAFRSASESGFQWGIRIRTITVTILTAAIIPTLTTRGLIMGESFTVRDIMGIAGIASITRGLTATGGIELRLDVELVV